MSNYPAPLNPDSPRGPIVPGPASSRLWTGGILLAAALGLIALAGCFLIGVMQLMYNFQGDQVRTEQTDLFLRTLYSLAFGCAAVAGILIVIGVRVLLKMGRNV